MTMVEALARVLCRSELLRQLGVPIGDGEPLQTKDLRRQAAAVLDTAVDELWPQHVPAVLSMLAVLRQPSDGMLSAGDDPALGLGPEVVEMLWQAMIDAATEYEEP